jgi:D-arabinan exo alpha-(1,3)/(1,5)-arabinofuranosidase (non-reducing end)
MIPPGEEVILAELIGPGCITHLWMTQFCRRLVGPGLIDPDLGSYVAPVFEIHNALGVNWEEVDPFYYRKVLLKIFWDDQHQPSVLVPLGDFFCIGHSMPGNFSSLPITVSCKPEERHRFGGSAALNCYFPMPFQKKAKVVIENQNDVPYGQYFYVDYELYPEPLPQPAGYFHAHWRRENPCKGWAPELQVNSPEVNVAHLDASGNYIVLETEGEGHYVGCNLSVAHFQGSWWGEGDEMIFIDGDDWPPSLHGTGSEDYFNHAWGMQDNAFLMNGSALHESVMPGWQVSYRFHLADPIHFSERILVSFEHGHANHLADDWSSTAYWYQTLPSPVKTILPVADRLPPVPQKAAVGQGRDPISPSTMTNDQRQALEAAHDRFSKYRSIRDEHIANKLQRTREYSRMNVEQALSLRHRFDRRARQ